MKKHFVPIHMVRDQGTFDQFEKGLFRYEKMIDFFRGKSNDFEFGLRLTMPAEKIDTDLVCKTLDLMEGLEVGMFKTYDTRSKGRGGPGLSTRQVHLNQSFTGGQVMCVCLDQQVVDTEEAVQRVIDLTDRIEKDNILYTAGARTVPIVLGVHKRNSHIREIYELFLASAAGSEDLRVKDPIPGLNPGYAVLGEPSTGMDIVNQAHPQFPELARGLIQASQTDKNMDGFSSCYYTPIKAGQLNSLGHNGYACSIRNPFTSSVTEEQEYAGVTSMIAKQTAALGRSDIGAHLRETVKSVDAGNTICNFYDSKDVRLVRDLMLDALPSKA